MRVNVRSNGHQKQRTSNSDPCGKRGKVNAWKTLDRTATRGGGTSVSIVSETYSFELHQVNSFHDIVRNVETYFGLYVATYGGLTEYYADLTNGNQANDYNFQFACHPAIAH